MTVATKFLKKGFFYFFVGDWIIWVWRGIIMVTLLANPEQDEQFGTV